MKLHFDSKLDFQLDAIQAVVGLFRGQAVKQRAFPVVSANGSVPNRLTLSPEQILENLQQIQEKNKIKPSANLESMDFSVEMETGTGKTYVYLRTILELKQKYGFQKFIIVVPSVAIREGVLKTLEITRQHFRQLYDNLPYHYYEYDSSKLSCIRQFARNNTVEIMVMTLDSFNKDKNIMNKSMDQLSGQRPTDFVQQARPILILDEPQNMESDISKDAIKQLNPLFKLRYSATHKSLYNLIYRLTPVDAYRQNLVKRIEVFSIIKENDFNVAYVRLESVDPQKVGGPKARIRVHKKFKSGFKEKTIIVSQGDNLYKKTKNKLYRDIRIASIDARHNFIKLSNGEEVKFGGDVGGNLQDLQRAQIRHTIEEHFRKTAHLKPYGIKVLSLFFIDAVANYAKEDGFIRKAFIEEYNGLKDKFSDFKDVSVGEVHAGYFSDYKNERYIKNDKDTYDLIMKDKEKLLSFEEPVQFIFSHSALREGWDNPNVFNICTLNRTRSEIKKRQEIGRGVRLPVNQEGKRIHDPELNILTVVANESYTEYVSRLQSEYIDEYGELFSPPMPPSARRRRTVRLKKGFKLNEDFKEIWNQIKKRTRYAIEIDTASLVSNCVQNIEKISVEDIKISLKRVELEIQEGGIGTQLLGSEEETLDTHSVVPDLLGILSEETKLTRTTILEILKKVSNLSLIFKNPQSYMQKVIGILQETLKDFLVSGIKYLEINEDWQMELFQNIDTYEEYVLPVEHSIYEGIIWDSKGEKTFAKRLEKDKRVKLFIKLPPWFVVDTPIGQYNPDWAIVMKKGLYSEGEKIYFVRETKFADLRNLRQYEPKKIDCAKKHFNLIGVDFKEGSEYEDLLKPSA